MIFQRSIMNENFERTLESVEIDRSVSKKIALFTEEKMTLVFLLVAAAIYTHLGISFFRGVETYIVFFFAVLIPCFGLLSLLLWLAGKKLLNLDGVANDPFTHENIFAILRVIAALFIGFYAYSHLKVIAPVINPQNYDLLLEKIDRLIFLGSSPTLALLQIKSKAWMFLMNISYQSFYPAFPLSFAAAFLAKDQKEMRELVTGILLIYFFGIILYYLVPALGPLFYTQELFAHIPNRWQPILWNAHLAIKADPQAFAGGPFFGVAAFPSLHSAHMLFLLAMAKRRHKFLFTIYVPWTILLLISTIYLGWHYVIDLVAGAAITFICLKLLRIVKIS